DETEFEIYRSVANADSYRLLATINPAAASGSTINYADVELFASTDYYYKVRVKGIGGYSAFTPEIIVKTLRQENIAPVISPIPNYNILYGTKELIFITATDATNDALVLTATGLPTFATFTDNGNGTATISIKSTSVNDA